MFYEVRVHGFYWWGSFEFRRFILLTKIGEQVPAFQQNPHFVQNVVLVLQIPDEDM